MSKSLLRAIIVACAWVAFGTGRGGIAAETADPFADLAEPAAAPGGSHAPPSRTVDWTIKRELFSQVIVSHEGGEDGDVASRQSVGGEVYARFSSRTATIAAADVQVRFVRRDNPIDVIDDPEATDHDGWAIELHNCYVEVYNILNPVLDDAGRSAAIGQFNLRIGKFYIPFGLNLQTDTHGTVLQLSNEQDFGFERDWYVGLWGSATEQLNYDVAYLLGSAHDPRFEAATYEQRKVGDRFYLSITPNGATAAVTKEYRVVGVLDRTGSQDDGTVFIPFTSAQKVFNRPNSLTIVGVKLKEFSRRAIEDFTQRWISLPEVQCACATPSWWVVGGGLTVLAAVLAVPPLRQLFHLAVLPPGELVGCVLGAAVTLLWCEGLKRWLIVRRVAEPGQAGPIRTAG